MTETSCSILLTCWSFLICPVTAEMSARNDGAEPMVRKENAIDHAESIGHLGIKTDQVELEGVYTIYFLSRFNTALFNNGLIASFGQTQPNPAAIQHGKLEGDYVHTSDSNTLTCFFSTS